MIWSLQACTPTWRHGDDMTTTSVDPRSHGVLSIGVAIIRNLTVMVNLAIQQLHNVKILAS
jgi:hypothetical protein